MADKKITVKPELVEEIRELCQENREILLVSLCTTDGFSIKCFASKGLNAEADKIAAMSSTICALSDSSAKQVLSDQSNATIVETSLGNILFVRTNYLGFQCVLTIGARTKMALATVRYKTNKLAESIESIDE